MEATADAYPWIALGIAIPGFGKSTCVGDKSNFQ
jgi:hypothetical protein